MCTRPCGGSRGQTLASSTRPWVPLKWSVPGLATERRGARLRPPAPTRRGALGAAQPGVEEPQRPVTLRRRKGLSG